MPPRIRCKSAKSTEIRKNSRKSPRKKKLPQETEDTAECSISEKTPKRKSRIVNLDKTTVPKRETVPKSESANTPSSFSTPSTSYSSDTEKTCAFYRTKSGSDGKPVFSKSLIKYFMTIDSPEMDDLKNKRYNTSFIREIPRDKSSIRIFSEEEDMHPKWLENVPKLDFNMPDIPGSEHAKIFESMPIGGDSDEELKKLRERGTKRQSRTEKKRKSTRCTEFKGKPLPDQALAVDYTSLLDSESSNDHIPDDVKETEMKRNGQETALSGAVSDNKDSILLTLLNAPVEGPIKPYKYNGLQASHCYNISSTLEDKMLLNKYKDLMGDEQVNVVLTREDQLPIEDQLLEFCEKKKLNLKSANEEMKRVSKGTKYNVHKKIKLPKVRLSKLQKKDHDNTES